jgi:hypothetical protein
VISRGGELVIDLFIWRSGDLGIDLRIYLAIDIAR